MWAKLGTLNWTLYLANYTNKTVERAHIYNASPSIQQTNTNTPAGITSALNTGATSKRHSMVITETIDATANGAGSIDVPTTLTSLSLDFQQKPTTSSSAPLKINGNTNVPVDNATQVLNIDMPGDATDMYMDIDAPTATVTLIGGTYAQVTAKTAINTLVIGEGTTVTKAIIKGGHVRVYGELTEIEFGDDCSALTIYKEASATIPANLPQGVTVVNVPEEELRAAINAATPGATITLSNDVELASAIVVDKDLTIDMSGNTLASVGNVLEVTAGTLTITGSGAVQAGSDGRYFAVWAKGGNVVIDGYGTYSVGADADGNTNDCIYAEGGSITINNGEFSNAGTFNPANGCVAYEEDDVTNSRIQWNVPQ